MSDKRERLAFVLGGGGARGAMQVGALRALWEAGYRPHMLVGTSVGAVNAAYLAVHGFTPGGLKGLEQAWHDAAQAALLPANPLRLAAESLLALKRIRGQARPQRARIRDFLVAHGIGPEITFGDLTGPKLLVVATDLSRGDPVLYGRDPEQSVLEGLLASTAVLPWVDPQEVGGRALMNGGPISNLPIEPAISHGATHIIALNLSDSRDIHSDASGLGSLPAGLIVAVEFRQIYLECLLARARGVPLYFLNLRFERPVPPEDFSRSAELIEHGYEIARRQIARWRPMQK